MLEHSLPGELLATAREVRCLVLDVDGVLSPSTLTYGADGEVLKDFDVRDGLGIRMLIESGREVAIITARASKPLARRMRDLGIEHYYPDSRNKLQVLSELADKLGLALSQFAYLGDDLLDAPCLERVGLPLCVGDAHPVARRLAAFATRAAGGAGAVREVTDWLLDAQFGLDVVHQQQLERERQRAASKAKVGFGIVIPARHASTRLPGKPLLLLAGKPMVAHVLDNARRTSADFVIVATDDERIAQVVREHGGDVVLTSPEHPTGTDRLAEVIQRRELPESTIIVNVQGDEPLLPSAEIERVARALIDNPAAGMATLATPIREPSELVNPNVVKVVRRRDGTALYFSRAAVPWQRGEYQALQTPSAVPSSPAALRHIGLYAYRADTVTRLAASEPAPAELAESLEQLRALDLGISIVVEVVDAPPGHGVDTQEDLEKVEAELLARASAGMAE